MSCTAIDVLDPLLALDVLEPLLVIEQVCFIGGDEIDGALYLGDGPLMLGDGPLLLGS